MQITLKAELEQFVEDQVKAGHYPSADAMVEAALLDMREGFDTELDDETIAAIDEGSEQAERGEGIDLEEFKSFMEKCASIHK